MSRLLQPLATSRLEGAARSLMILNLSDNKLGGNKCTRALESVLQENIRLVQLDLSWNLFKQTDAVRMAKSLRDNATLLSLNLAVNSIGSEGTGAIAAALSDNSNSVSIVALDFSFNRVTAPACGHLAKMIEKCANLQRYGVSTLLLKQQRPPLLLSSLCPFRSD